MIKIICYKNILICDNFHYIIITFYLLYIVCIKTFDISINKLRFKVFIVFTWIILLLKFEDFN